MSNTDMERIRRELRSAGIPADRAERDWQESEDNLLGTDTDNVVGKKVGRSRTAVTLRRQRLQIPPYRKIKGEHVYASGIGSIACSTIILDVTTTELLSECQTLLAKELYERGYPVKRLNGWQIVNMLCRKFLDSKRESK
jgi:hypothetical protein